MQDFPVIDAKKKLAAAITALDLLVFDLQKKISDRQNALQDEARAETIRRLIENESNALCHLQDIIKSTRIFWSWVDIEFGPCQQKSPQEQQRIADNITLITHAIKTVIDPEASVSSQWKVICDIHYQPSRMEKYFATCKKTLMTLCAALAGFVVCTLMGMTITGGILGVPAAIFASLKSIASLWGTAGAGAATIALGPSFFGIMMAQGQLVKETSAPLETEMIKVKANLIQASKDALQQSLENKMQALRTLGTEPSRRALQMLEAILQRAWEHVSTASRWYCLDYDARRNKAQALFLATDQVLTHLLSLESPCPANFSKMALLALPVQLDGKTCSFGSVLLKPRAFQTLRGSFFSRSVTETSRRADDAWERRPIFPSPNMGLSSIG